MTLSEVVRNWLLSPVLDRLTRMEANMATNPQAVALQDAANRIEANVQEQGPLAQALLAAFAALQAQVADVQAELAEANVTVPAVTQKLTALDGQMDTLTAAIRASLPAQTPTNPAPPAPGA